jgi:hypothetical protein
MQHLVARYAKQLATKNDVNIIEDICTHHPLFRACKDTRKDTQPGSCHTHTYTHIHTYTHTQTHTPKQHGIIPMGEAPHIGLSCGSGYKDPKTCSMCKYCTDFPTN